MTKQSAHDKSLRQHIAALLRGGGAHLNFDHAIRGIPPRLRGKRAAGLPHTSWQLLEHLRIAVWDLLEFSRDAKHVSPEWPAGYWPKSDAPPHAAAWNRSVKEFRRDMAAMQALVSKSSTDLFARIPHGTGQTILREALIVADHNAYHIGQLVLVRRALGCWKES
jgi:hypothetical protein